MFQDTSAENILEYLVYPFRLFARLRVEGGAERELGSEGFLELLPESRGELRAPFRYNVLGDSVKAHNMLNVEASQLVAQIGGTDRDEVRHLGQMVDNDPYSVMASAGPG
ncbi:hypothetical protein ZWY2020_040640 [Hordeum vulgare]|nr:hypothetical protein ZWY2020_040640 [Hordeum vulgare]